MHYVAVFACYMISKIIRNQHDEEETVEVPKLSLLAPFPMNALPPENVVDQEEESNQTSNFKAEVLVHFLNETFKYYNFDGVAEFATCQVCDSVSSNIRAASLLLIPHLDCNNHTLNLEVKKMIEVDKPLSHIIESIHDLMVLIKRSLKNTAVLRKLTHIPAIIENKTR